MFCFFVLRESARALFFYIFECRKGWGGVGGGLYCV